MCQDGIEDALAAFSHIMEAGRPRVRLHDSEGTRPILPDGEEDVPQPKYPDGEKIKDGEKYVPKPHDPFLPLPFLPLPFPLPNDPPDDVPPDDGISDDDDENDSDDYGDDGGDDEGPDEGDETVQMVYWSIDGDNPCNACIENSEVGNVPIGTIFPSGDVAPPAHLRCACTLRDAESDFVLDPAIAARMSKARQSKRLPHSPNGRYQRETPKGGW